MFLHHPIPTYIPLEMGLGKQERLTDSLDTNPVPLPLPAEDERQLSAKDRDLDARDAYFLGMLLAVHQGRKFSRGSLYWKRLKRLLGWEVVPVSETNYLPDSSHSMLRVDLDKAMQLLAAFDR